MKRVVILLAVVVLPFLAFAQTYDQETAKKFYRAIDILSDAKAPFESSSWGATGTGGPGSSGLTLQRYYNTEKITKSLQNEGLDKFLSDKNNRIALAAVADYVTDHSSYLTWNNDYETLLTIGIDPVEAAIRMNDEDYVQGALNGSIAYLHCYTSDPHQDPFGGHMEAIREPKVKSVNTSREKIEAIRTQLKNEEPLIEQFKEKMEKLNRQIRKENRRNALKRLEKRILNSLENAGRKIQEAGQGINYQHG